MLTEQLVGSGLDGGVVCYHGGMDSGSRSKAQAKVRITFNFQKPFFYV